MNVPIPRRPAPLVAASLLAIAGLAALSVGCGGARAPDPAATAPGTGGPTQTKVKLAYIGLTCEAAMFVAREKGFFTDEGLDVEFVKTDWDSLRDGLGLGRFDANYTLIMYLLKPIEQGLDVRITGGVHTGCLRIQAGAQTAITTVEGLKGKRIGIPTMGSPPFLFASRVLAAHGMDPKKDVEWVVVAPDVMELALANGQVEAIADSEPLGSILLAREKVRTVADQGADAPYRDEYCCATVVSGKFAARDPEAAAGMTRALLKGAKWVHENPTAAAELSVEKKYIAASPEINARALAQLTYVPGVSRCRESLDRAAREMKAAGLLNPTTDPADLARRAWLDLRGVTDEWVAGLKVETIPGGGPPAANPAALAALLGGRGSLPSCCSGK
ncbi:MAG TPA: ABC transporter substrate-binding protein [Isosphaeraceae bacterium]|jgi:NitT/TauT family transport system substrate-binding protein